MLGMFLKNIHLRKSHQKKSNPNHPLTEEEEQQNAEISCLRAHVGRYFGRSNQLFPILEFYKYFVFFSLKSKCKKNLYLGFLKHILIWM